MKFNCNPSHLFFNIDRYACTHALLVVIAYMMEPSNGALYNASNRLHIIAGPPASISAGGITLPNTVGNGPVNVGATRVAVRTFIYTLESV